VQFLQEQMRVGDHTINTILVQNKEAVQRTGQRPTRTSSPLAMPTRADEHALVMCHGFGGGVGIWYRNLAEISRRAQRPVRVYAFDWRGMGLSSRSRFDPATVQHATDPELSEQEYTERWFLESFEEWRMLLGLERFTLLGHSFGGYLAGVYAMQRPECVAHLVLASPVGLPPRPAGFDFNELASRSLFHRVAVYAWTRRMTPQSLVRLGGPFGRRLVNFYTRRRFRSLPEAELDSLSEYLLQISCAPPSGEHALHSILEPGAYAHRPLLPRFLVHREHLPPITFVYGLHDWMDCASAYELAEASSAGQVRVLRLPNAGHHMYMENPEEFNDAVVRVLDGQ
jgi:cardiolipin-specific phospholipase